MAVDGSGVRSGSPFGAISESVWNGSPGQMAWRGGGGSLRASLLRDPPPTPARLFAPRPVILGLRIGMRCQPRRLTTADRPMSCGKCASRSPKFLRRSRIDAADNMTCIWEQQGWPDLCWDTAKLSLQLADVRHRQGVLLGRVRLLGFELREEAALRKLT